MKKLRKLRDVPDELIIPGEGGKVRLMNTGVLECFCSKCRCEFWVKSNVVNCCPSCMDEEVSTAWTTPRVAFIPQGPSEY